MRLAKARNTISEDGESAHTSTTAPRYLAPGGRLGVGVVSFSIFGQSSASYTIGLMVRRGRAIRNAAVGEIVDELCELTGTRNRVTCLFARVTSGDHEWQYCVLLLSGWMSHCCVQLGIKDDQSMRLGRFWKYKATCVRGQMHTTEDRSKFASLCDLEGHGRSRAWVLCRQCQSTSKRCRSYSDGETKDRQELGKVVSLIVTTRTRG